MPNYQVWACDICRHEQRKPMDPRRMYDMAVTAGRADRHYAAHTLHSMLVCEDCLTERKLYNPEPTRTEPQYVTTFEDMLREIVREEIEAKG